MNEEQFGYNLGQVTQFVTELYLKVDLFNTD